MSLLFFIATPTFIIEPNINVDIINLYYYVVTIKGDIMKGKKVSFYFVRHGETELNVKELAQGQCDSPLTTDGINQTKQLKTLISNIDFDQVYSSPLERSLNTTKLITNQEIHLDDRLMEISFGSLEETTYDVLYGDGLDYIMEDGWRKYGGESYHDLRERVIECIEDIVDRQVKNHSNILISSHGVSIIMFLKWINNDIFSITKGMLKNCSLSQVDYIDGEYFIKRVNEV